MIFLLKPPWRFCICPLSLLFFFTPFPQIFHLSFSGSIFSFRSLSSHFPLSPLVLFSFFINIFFFIYFLSIFFHSIGYLLFLSFVSHHISPLYIFVLFFSPPDWNVIVVLMFFVVKMHIYVIPIFFFFALSLSPFCNAIPLCRSPPP